MFDLKYLANLLFLDVETVPQCPSFDKLDDRFKDFWEKKSAFFRKEDQSAEEVYERAGIYAEFGKIVCISVGRFTEENGERQFKTKSFYGDDEKELLEKFSKLLTKQYADLKMLCAHNGKEFDFPYISRRLLINRLPLPPQLDTFNKKPWDIAHFDTLQFWKFGDYKHFTSLDLMAALFNIPSPKDDMDGSQVASAYWQEHNLERIKTYCQKDVITLAQLFLKLHGQAFLTADQITEAL